MTTTEEAGPDSRSGSVLAGDPTVGPAEPAGPVGGGGPVNAAGPAGEGLSAVGPDGKSLGGKVRTGLVWGLINNGLSRAGTTVMGIVVARILDPHDFGVFAVALVVYNGILSINELGVSLAIIRWPRDVESIEGTVATISITSSALLYGACFFTAPWLAHILGAPSATGIVRILCLGVVIDGIIAVPAAWLQREFRQERQTLIDQTNFVVGAVVTIALAAHGSGAWSLAWGRLAGNLVSIAMVLVLCPRPFRVGFDRAVAREVLSFGSPLAAASALVFAVLNVDYIVVGAMLGPVALGIYVLAFNLSSWPVNMLSTAVRRVSFAGFSRLQDDTPALHQSFLRALRLLATATVPVCALLGALSHPAINFVYGPKWAAAAPILTFLVVLGGCRVILELAYDYLVAAGRSRVCMTVQAIWLAALVPGLAIAAGVNGTRGVARGHVIVAVVVVLPAFAVALRRTGLDIRASFRAILLPVAGGAAAAAVAVLVARRFDRDVVALVVAGLAGLAAYAPFALYAVRPWRPGRARPTPTPQEAAA